jgi:uncharacterized SAM-binding protein YcdF (DUF218 family)
VKGFLLTFVMPPTGMITLLLAGLLLTLRRRRAGLALIWVGTLGLYLLGTPFIANNMLLALETDLPTEPPADHKPAAIVVLGGEIIRSHTSQLHARPGPLTFERLQTAAALARKTGLPILVSGGLTQADTPAVATVMAKSLTDDFGVPPRWIEDESADTWENARLSAAILHNEGIDSIYVVTNSWHMPRALLSFAGTDLHVTAAPTPLDDPLAPQLWDFMPQATSWVTSFYALHEWIGYAWYRLR